MVKKIETCSAKQIKRSAKPDLSDLKSFQRNIYYKRFEERVSIILRVKNLSAKNAMTKNEIILNQFQCFFLQWLHTKEPVFTINAFFFTRHPV